MNMLFILCSDDGETLYNAVRLANACMGKGHEVSVFMLGKGVTYEAASTERFDVKSQVEAFEGDFYV